MRITDTVVPTAVLSVLRAAIVTENSLTLTGQLDRKTYTDTAAVLDRIGGKWDKKAKCHLFDTESDVRGLVAEMLDTQQMPRKAPVNELAYFATPPSIVFDALSKFDDDCFTPGFTWREPSAGEGAFVDGLTDRGVLSKFISMIEVDETRHAVLCSRGYPAICADFLNWNGETVDFTVMNPPFSKGGLRTLYVDHINHAWSMTGSELISVAPASVKWATDAKTTALRELALETGWIEDLPDGSFKEVGTLVGTVLLCLSR